MPPLQEARIALMAKCTDSSAAMENARAYLARLPGVSCNGVAAGRSEASGGSGGRTPRSESCADKFEYKNGGNYVLDPAAVCMQRLHRQLREADDPSARTWVW